MTVQHIDGATGEVLPARRPYVHRERERKDRPRHTDYELAVLAGRVRRTRRPRRGKRSVRAHDATVDLVLALAVYSAVMTVLWIVK